MIKPYNNIITVYINEEELDSLASYFFTLVLLGRAKVICNRLGKMMLQAKEGEQKIPRKKLATEAR